MILTNLRYCILIFQLSVQFDLLICFLGKSVATYVDAWLIIILLFLKQVSYSSQNWPVLHVVASDDGMYLAVAGSHGLVLYDLRNKRWRFFGDVTQEQKIQCKGLLWLGKIVIVCNYVESSNTLVSLSYLSFCYLLTISSLRLSS
jgi:hypothetical protein